MDTMCELPTASGIFQSVLASTDCAIAERVGQAYAALQAPGSGFAQITTILLTIYVAIIGYRLVLGYAGLRLAELVPHFVKIGVALALITSWPAYQILVFNLLFHAPEELAAAVTATPSSGGANNGDVLDALQVSYDRIATVAEEAWSNHPAPELKSAKPADPFASAAPDAAPGGVIPAAGQLGQPQFAALLLWLSAFVMVAASVGALLVLHIVLALLLLVGPFFILAGLFAGTRGLLEGWLRMAVGYALAPLFVTLGSAGLVVVLAPFLIELEASPTVPETSTVLAVALIIGVFAAVLWQAAKLSGGIARGIRLPRMRPVAPTVAPASVPAAQGTYDSPASTPSRADLIVQAITSSADRSTSRERTILLAAGTNSRTTSSPAGTGDRADTTGRLGQSARRTSVTPPRLPPPTKSRAE